MSGSPQPAIVLGAGNLGRRMAKAIRPLLFCDNNPALWGTEVESTLVVSPEEAVRNHPGALYVVAIWHPCTTESMLDRMDQLRRLGARNVLPFTAFLNQYPEHLLPNLLWERPAYYAAHADEIARARPLFDAPGQEEFDRQMKLRLGDHSGQVIDRGVQYFPEDLPLEEDEVFIDCGAYDGDTIAALRAATGDRFARALAFEPDPGTFELLRTSIGSDPRIQLHQSATGARREKLRFTRAGTGSRLTSSGTEEVEVNALDELLGDVKPTYIKLDIEGAEPDALRGAVLTIQTHRPKIAVCLYHAPDHLWSIPLWLNEALPDSRLTLRTYAADGFECVCYCIPNELEQGRRAA
jgi:FkbM family methyltransferase